MASAPVPIPWPCQAPKTVSMTTNGGALPSRPTVGQLFPRGNR